MKALTVSVLLLVATMMLVIPALAQTAPAAPQEQSEQIRLLLNTANDLSTKIDNSLQNTPDNPDNANTRKTLLQLQGRLTEAMKHTENLAVELPQIRQEFLLLPQENAEVNPPAQGAGPANTNIAAGISVGLGGTDSFNRDVKATADILYPVGKLPTPASDAEGVLQNGILGEAIPQGKSRASGELIPIVHVSYDDKWKALPTTPGKPNLSNLTQTYSGQLLYLSNLLGIHTMASGAIYHDNSQGIVYDLEPALGIFARFPNPAKQGKLKKKFLVYLGVAAQGDIDSRYGSAHTTYDEGVRTYFLWQWKPKAKSDTKGVVIGSDQHDCSKPDPNTAQNEVSAIAQACSDIKGLPAFESRHTFAVNFIGFLPPADPTIHGHASAMVEYDYKLSSKFSLSFSVLDSYYATVSPTYSHNSLTPSFSIKFTPPSSDGQ